MTRRIKGGFESLAGDLMTDRPAIEEMDLNSGTGRQECHGANSAVVDWRGEVGPRGGVRYARNSGCLAARSDARSLARQSELTSFRNVSVLRWRGWAHARILFHCQNGGKIKYFWLIAFRSFPDVSLRVQL